MATTKIPQELLEKTSITFADNEKLRFGTSDDLQIYHDSSNSYIKDQGTGQLVIDGNAVILQYSSGTKLTTTSTGIDVTGGLTTSGDITLPSSGQINASGALYLDSDVTHFRLNNETELMRIQSSGVGIGTNSPGYKLDLGGTTGNTANTLRLHQNNGGTALRIGAGGGSSDVVLWRIDGDSSGSPANHAGATNLGAYGYSLKYFGTGSGQENRLKLLADNGGNSSQNVVYNVGQNGDINFEQKVGIGTTSPANKLHVSDGGGAGLEINPQTANDRVILFAYDRSASTYQSMDFDALDYHFNPGGTEKVRIDSSGNVGIGTSSPSSFYSGARQLVVGSGSGEQGITVYGGNANTSYLLFADGTSGAELYAGQVNYSHANNALNFLTNGITTPRMTIDSSGNVTIASGIFTTIHDITTVNKFKTTNNNTRAAISMESKDSSGNAVDLRMHALGDGPRGEIFTYTNHPLAFATNNAAPQMTLLTNGNFGIGTTTASQKLDVDGTIQTSVGLRVAGHPVVGYASITGGYAAQLGSTGSSTLNETHIYSGGTLRAVFDGSGNFGIGTTSPAVKLDINGNAAIRGTSGRLYFDTSGAVRTNFVGTINNFETVVATNRGNAGFIVLGNADIRLGFGTNHNTSETDLYITSAGNVGIGTTSPQTAFDVETATQSSVVSVGIKQMSVNNYAGIHFGYKENNGSYRKSAIVFKRTDLTSNDAQGQVHILNGPQNSSASATLTDSAFMIDEYGNNHFGRQAAIASEDSFTQQTYQFYLDAHVNGSDEAAEEKDAVFSKIWRKSAVLHPGKYANNSTYYVGIGVNSSDTVNYVTFKVNLYKATQLYSTSVVANSADGTTRANKIYYSTDDLNYTQGVSNNWAAGGNTAEYTLAVGTMAGSTSGYFTGTVYLKFAIEGSGSGHTNLIGWHEFNIRARAQEANLEGGGFGRSKNDLTLSGQADTGHGYAPLTHTYGHAYSGTNQAAIISANGGLQSFATKGLGHEEKAIFNPITSPVKGLQVLASGVLHIDFNQDIITTGSSSYVSCTVHRRNSSNSANVVVGGTLRTNTNGQWDMIQGSYICDVVAGDIITFSYNATGITHMDGGQWANYNFTLHPSKTTSQGFSGSSALPWIHQ